MYKSRDITNVKTAKIAIDALTINDDCNKFKSLFTKITTTANKKQEKSSLKRNIKTLLNSLNVCQFLGRIRATFNVCLWTVTQFLLIQVVFHFTGPLRFKRKLVRPSRPKAPKKLMTQSSP